MKDQKFFMLFAENGNAPTAKWYTMEDAKTEAARIVSKTGKQVYILEALYRFDPVTQYSRVELKVADNLYYEK